ncbi:MAG TPA: hypothetical protein VIY26_00415 [Acidimicrobiales bacterium]
MRQRRMGGVLAALCIAACAIGALAIGLLAPASRAGPGKIIDSGLSPVQADASSNTLGVPRATGSPVPGAVTEGRRTRSVASSAPQSFVAQATGLPPAGEATRDGCAAAYAYLQAYAAPGFTLECPGDAGGHEAETMCVSGATPCSTLRLIVVADPCPAAYMNEASNSWTLLGASDAPIDPYGSCR